jgi:outer membrane protein OmpA-like peptidoglycan-associated protein
LAGDVAAEVGDMVYLNDVRLQAGQKPQLFIVSGAKGTKFFGQHVKDIFFDFDKYNIREDQQASMQADAQFLLQHANVKFTIRPLCVEHNEDCWQQNRRAHFVYQKCPI